MRSKFSLSLFTIILLIFFLTGFSGLVYQVVWVKLLGRVFGITTFAISAVLGAYMGGLALGGFVGGKLTERKIDGVKIFGYLEIAIALYALLLFPLFDNLINLYRTLYSTLENSPALLTFVRFTLSFGLLVIPTTFMGASLPLLIKALVTQREELSAKLSQLYSVQTFGSVLGSLLTGFLLIGILGLRTSTWIAVLFDLMAGVIALIIAQRIPIAERATVLQTTAPDPAPPATLSYLIPAIMFLSGFASLGYEVAWTRVLATISDHSVYTFSGIVVTVLIGITVGSWLVSWFGSRIANPAHWLIASQSILAISAALWMPALILLGNWFAPRNPDDPAMFLIGGTPFFYAALAITLIPSLCMGFNFPLAAQLHARESERLGQQVGNLLSINLIGAMFGSILVGFIFIPLLGTQRTLLGLGGINLIAALWLTASQQIKWGRNLGYAVAAGLIIMASLAPNSFYISIFNQFYFDQPVIANFEGAEATVTVTEKDQIKTLYLNGAHQANTSTNMLGIHRSIGYLPTIVNPNIKRVLIIGLGGGATSGAVAQRTESVRVIELSDGMVEGARLFGAANQFVLDQSNVQLIVNDGRNFVALTDQKYDLIAADIIPPLHAYSSNLYSIEYFRMLATRLNKNGLVSQWVDTSLRPHEQAILTRTFVQAFPYAVVWEAGGFRIVLGSNDPILLNVETINQSYTPEVATAFKVLKVNSPVELHAAFRVANANYKQELGAGLIIDDDHPYNEYFRLLRVRNIWRFLK